MNRKKFPVAGELRGVEAPIQVRCDEVSQASSDCLCLLCLQVFL